MASSRRLAAWYFQLGQSLEAGVPLLEALAAPGPESGARAALVGRLRTGAALVEELARADWLPRADAHLLMAGAEAGRLPAVCARLSAQHEMLSRLQGRALLAVLYPLLVVHVGVVALPLRHLVLGSPLVYVRQVALGGGAVWLVLGALWGLGRIGGLRRRVFAVLPWLGSYQRARDLGVLAQVLDGYLSAGVSPVTAWQAAGDATGAPRLRALGRRVAAEAEAGRQPGLALAREPAVPLEFAQAYRTGEQSGRLDGSLAWLARRYGEEAERKLTHASLWYPQIVLLGVAVWVGVNVVSLYAGYLRDLLNLME